MIKLIIRTIVVSIASDLTALEVANEVKEKGDKLEKEKAELEAVVKVEVPRVELKVEDARLELKVEDARLELKEEAARLELKIDGARVELKVEEEVAITIAEVTLTIVVLAIIVVAITILVIAITVISTSMKLVLGIFIPKVVVSSRVAIPVITVRRVVATLDISIRHLILPI